jgi:hypothetical protein
MAKTAFLALKCREIAGGLSPEQKRRACFLELNPLPGRRQTTAIFPCRRVRGYDFDPSCLPYTKRRLSA